MEKNCVSIPFLCAHLRSRFDKTTPTNIWRQVSIFLLRRCLAISLILPVQHLVHDGRKVGVISFENGLAPFHLQTFVSSRLSTFAFKYSESFASSETTSELDLILARRSGIVSVDENLAVPPAPSNHRSVAERGFPSGYSVDEIL